MDIGAYQSNSVALTSIAVAPSNSSNPTLAAGLAVQFTATGNFAGGTTLNFTNLVTWASAMPGVAAIGATGLATALAAGTSVITAYMAGVTTSVTLTVFAPSFVVNTILDPSSFSPGVTSLRQAIAEASAVASGQAVTFDPTVFASAQTIVLTGGPLMPTNTSGKLTITGPASSTAAVTIYGQFASRDFSMKAGQNVELDNLVIYGGLAATGGGVQSNGGSLTFKNDAFTTDVAFGAAGQAALGGAVDATGGSASFSNCTFTTDDAGSNYYTNAMGGAVYSNGATVSFTSCTFTNDAAIGGIGAAGAANTAANGTAGSGGAGSNGYGGAVAAEGSGSLTLTLCTFTSDIVFGGAGGAGGANTGTSGKAGSGGGGGSSYGAGLMVDAGTVSIQTTTFGSCTAYGASGGRGGDNTSSTLTPGTGGAGGARRAAGWRYWEPARPPSSIPRSALIRRRAARAVPAAIITPPPLQPRPSPAAVAAQALGVRCGQAAVRSRSPIRPSPATPRRRAPAAPAARRPI